MNLQKFPNIGAPLPALCLGEVAQMAELSLGSDVGLCSATPLCSHREDGDSTQTCQDGLESFLKPLWSFFRSTSERYCVRVGFSHNLWLVQAYLL